MEDHEKFRESVRQIRRLITAIFILFGAVAAVLVYITVDPSLSAFKSSAPDEEYVTVPQISEEDFDKIENGIHVRTGFVEGDGLMLVVNNCTNCHSAKLVTQNRMSKERWVATIRWMQETQNLWDLGNNEEAIVNYLATNYAPTDKGRRQNLTDIEWYELEN
jgi:hypothetical protein